MNKLLQRLELRRNVMRQQGNCNSDELQTILNWFKTYDNQVAEYNRCTRMGYVCEHNIIELDIEAEAKRARIKEIRNNKSLL